MALTIDGATSVTSTLGKGFAYPVKVGKDGRMKTAEGTDHLKGCLTRLAVLRRGDVAGVYHLGGGIFGTVFGVNSVSLKRDITEAITNTVLTYETRISNVKVLVSPSATEPTKLDITAIYTIAGTKLSDKASINY